MICDPSEALRATSGTSVGGISQPRSPGNVKEGNARSQPRLSNSCDLFDLPVIGDQLTDKKDIQVLIIVFKRPNISKRASLTKHAPICLISRGI